MNTATGPPWNGRHFYVIHENDDRTVDVFLDPQAHPITTRDGITDFDLSFSVVRGIQQWDGMEEDIRSRYGAWRESGEVIYL